MELITAMLVAAARPLIREVAIAQKGPTMDCALSIAMLIPAITPRGA
jgi:hypothetical protein